MHKLVSQADLSELKKKYIAGEIGYKESKEILFKNLNAFLAPLRAKREEIAKDEERVKQILERGGKKAREITEIKMRKIRQLVGVN